jgi:hypothetical protein
MTKTTDNNKLDESEEVYEYNGIFSSNDNINSIEHENYWESFDLFLNHYYIVRILLIALDFLFLNIYKVLL